MLYHMVKRIILFKFSHTKRDFVQNVDFITASGFGTDLDEWQRPGGPSKTITNLGVMKMDNERKKICLDSVHPGVSPETVIENTGFEIEVPSAVPETKPPTREELTLLRTAVVERLGDIYPVYAEKWKASLNRPAG